MPQRGPNARQRKAWQASPESAAYHAAARELHDKARARVQAYREQAGESDAGMASKTGSYRVGGRGAVDKAQYILVDCEYQGGSKQDCSEPIRSVRVTVDFPTNFTANVHVCDTHYPAYVAVARRAGILA